MSNSITISNIAYAHTEDIDPGKRIDANRIDDAMKVAVRRAINVLENATGHYDDFQRFNMQMCLRSALTTHSAVRAAIRRGDEDPTSIEALALARLPLENLYTICLFTDDAEWVDVYVRDGWKKRYVQFLLQKEETRMLKRFKSYSDGAEDKLKFIARTVGITNEQIATIEHQQLELPMPSGMSESNIPHFPTPFRAIGKLSTGTKRKMLERLYLEYVFLCSFVHGLPNANLFKTVFDKDSNFRDLWSKRELEATFRKQVAQRAFATSFLSILQSATEITTLYPYDVDLIAGVVDAWQNMSRDSLLGKAIWSIRTSSLLGILES